MKKSFPGHYRPNESEFTFLWDHCIFVLDANVLLNLYRYSSETSSKLLDILDKISDRLWIPFQVALEYQENRLDVILKQKNAYTDIEQLLKQSQTQLGSNLKNYLKHPLININPLLEQISSLFLKIIDDLNKQEKDHPDLITNDTLRERITYLFDGKVGPSYPRDKLKSIFEEGEKRYEQNVPPGYLDADRKKGENKYGDLVLWYQIIDNSIATQKPIILVTDDTKEDWWWIFKSKTIGPRPELVEEFLAKTQNSFYIYSSDQFMEYARKYLKQHVEQNAINEVRKVREIDVYTSLIVKSFDEEINKLSERMINLYQERNLYEEHKTNVQKEIFSIIKKMQSLPSKDSHETNSEVITELHNRLGYLRREMLSAQDNYDNICRNIDELKCEEESIKKFKDHFGNRYDNLIKGFINDFDS